MDLGILGACRFDQDVRQMLTKRFRQTYMRHQPIAEEGARALARPIDKLIGNHQMTGRDFLAQAAHGADGNNPFNPELFERENIRAKIQLGGKPAMAFAVARQKNQSGLLEAAANELV